MSRRYIAAEILPSELYAAVLATGLGGKPQRVELHALEPLDDHSLALVDAGILTVCDVVPGHALRYTGASWSVAFVTLVPDLGRLEIDARRGWRLSSDDTVALVRFHEQARRGEHP